MNKTHIRAYTKALVEAAMHKATALEIELSVGMAVMYECAPSKRLGRETLLTVYNGAGWQCDKPGALDWRAVNRRITACVALYDHLTKSGDLAQALDGVKPVDSVAALRPLVAALKVKSVNEVLLACEKVRPPRKPAEHHEGVRVDAGHLHIFIPPSCTREDLIAMATKLMTMAASTDPNAATVDLDETVEA